MQSDCFVVLKVPLEQSEQDSERAGAYFPDGLLGVQRVTVRVRGVRVGVRIGARVGVRVGVGRKVRTTARLCLREVG